MCVASAAGRQGTRLACQQTGSEDLCTIIHKTQKGRLSPRPHATLPKEQVLKTRFGDQLVSMGAKNCPIKGLMEMCGRENCCSRTLQVRNDFWGTSTDQTTAIVDKQEDRDWVVWRETLGPLRIRPMHLP